LGPGNHKDSHVMALIDKQKKKDYSQSQLQVILPCHSAALLNIWAIFDLHFSLILERPRSNGKVSMSWIHDLLFMMVIKSSAVLNVNS
jgi:hypothetical protein